MTDTHVDLLGHGWLAMVQPRFNQHVESRPCVLCGDNRCTVRKTMLVDTVLQHLDTCAKVFHHHRMWTIMENVCLSAIAVQKHLQAPKTRTKAKHSTQHENVCVCQSCSHWMLRKHKPIHVPPLFDFKWHLVTLTPLNSKRLDKRIVHRMATIISQENNYYRTLFTPQELECIREMQQLTPRTVSKAIKKLYTNQNNDPLFVLNAHVADFMRKN
tara:strand:+ start:1672 stop:2313 length:642 start_codon:yes stop_codon:yes gene_type:complete